MNKREQRKIVWENRQRLFLDAWQTEKAWGNSLSAFCRSYGLSRKNFYLWLKRAGQNRRSPVYRSDPKLRQKAVEIYLRYKGTWSAETISMIFQGKLGAWTIRKAIKPYRDLWSRPSTSPKKGNRALGVEGAPNLIGSVDWTEYKLRSGKIFILLFLDETSRFWLGWEIFEARPRTEDLTGCLEHILARYQARPLFLKSDRAKVFMTPAWEILLARHGILPYRVRPHCPQDQGAIERAIRDVKTWLRANQPQTLKEARICMEEGIFMLNFLKPRGVLMAKTPAAVYLGKPLSSNPAHSALSDPGLAA